MDPNAALELLRALAAEMDAAADEASAARIASDLVTAFIGLDEWLTQGGFVPHAWTRATATPALPDTDNETCRELCSWLHAYDHTRRALQEAETSDDRDRWRIEQDNAATHVVTLAQTLLFGGNTR